MEITIKAPMALFAEGITSIRLVPDKEVTTRTKKGLTIADVVAHYNEYAVRLKWVKSVKQSEKLKQAITDALKTYSTREDWEAILKGLEKHPFFSGATGVYDNTNIMTIFHAKRYGEFFDAGMANNKATPLDIVSDWQSKLDALE